MLSSTNYLFISPSTNTVAASQTTSDPVTGSWADLPSAINSSDTDSASYWKDINAQERFEIYLDSPEISKAQVNEYLQTISLVTTCLKKKDAIHARQFLDSLSQYSGLDSGFSQELGNRIDAVWETQKDKSQIEAADNQLQHLIDQPDRNPDEIADAIRKQSNDLGSNPVKAPPLQSFADDSSATNVTALPPPDGVPGSTQLTQEYIRTVQIKAQIKANEATKEKLLDQCKSDFIQYILQLYNSHRYYHVAMASLFYSVLFKEDNYPAEIALQVTNSSNINNEVSVAIEGMLNNSDEGNIATAANQLREAYMLSAYDPELFRISVTQKAPIKTFERQFTKLQNMIQAKDFANLEIVVDTLGKLAHDFDVTKTIEAMDAVKSKSQLLLNKGKLAIQQGNLKQGLEDFQNAEEVWPSNPDLKGGAFPLFNSEEGRNRCLGDFDQLTAEHDYVAISDNRMEFFSAISNDTKRQQQLKDALEKVNAADAAVEKANVMKSHGDVDGAWEIIQLAIQEWPDNVRLNKLRGELADKAADFVSAIHKAQEAESRRELGYSLTWYAIAQHDYSASVFAAQAIPRVSKSILERL
jgi:hypothetical protein